MDVRNFFQSSVVPASRKSAKFKDPSVFFGKSGTTNITFSEEQELIAEDLRQGRNVVVEARAGCGKTTTCVCIHQRNPDKRILLLVYNRNTAHDSKLSFEKLTEKFFKTIRKLRDKTKLIENVDIRTLHGHIKYLYGIEGEVKDVQIQHLLDNDSPMAVKCKIDLLIIDEKQDFRPLYVEMILKMLRDLRSTFPEDHIQLCTLGDRYQEIYGFNGADKRFLTEAARIYSDANAREWVSRELSETFRLSKANAEFVNKVVLQRDHYKSKKKGPKPIVFRGNPKNVKKLFEKHGWLEKYQPDDIFVLDQSIKHRYLTKLSDYFASKNIPIHFATNDNEATDPELLKGKAVFTTVHKAKGRERKLVIAFGVDDDRVRRSDDGLELTIVQFTRSSEQLVIVEYPSKPRLSFMKYDGNEDLYDLEEDNSSSGSSYRNSIESVLSVSVTSLTAFQSHVDLSSMMKFIEVQVLEKMQDHHPLSAVPVVIEHNGLKEDVSAVNGVALNLLIEYSKRGRLEIIENPFAADMKLPPELGARILKYKNPFYKFRISDFVMLAVCQLSADDGTMWRFSQLPNDYSWLDDYEDELMNVVASSTSASHFEKGVGIHFGGVRIKGRCDALCIDDERRAFCVQEHKFISGPLQDEHKIQAAMYHWISDMSLGRDELDRFSALRCQGTLLRNFKTNELLLVKYLNGFGEGVMKLIDNRMRLCQHSPSEEFYRYVDSIKVKWSGVVESHFQKEDDEIVAWFQQKFTIGETSGPKLQLTRTELRKQYEIQKNRKSPPRFTDVLVNRCGLQLKKSKNVEKTNNIALRTARSTR